MSSEQFCRLLPCRNGVETFSLIPIIVSDGSLAQETLPWPLSRQRGPERGCPRERARGCRCRVPTMMQHREQHQSNRRRQVTPGAVDVPQRGVQVVRQQSGEPVAEEDPEHQEVRRVRAIGHYRHCASVDGAVVTRSPVRKASNHRGGAREGGGCQRLSAGHGLHHHPAVFM